MKDKRIPGKIRRYKMKKANVYNYFSSVSRIHFLFSSGCKCPISDLKIQKQILSFLRNVKDTEKMLWAHILDSCSKNQSHNNRSKLKLCVCYCILKCLNKLCLSQNGKEL